MDYVFYIRWMIWGVERCTVFGPSQVAGEELIADVGKSLEIFTAMKKLVVARRCAELTEKILPVVKKHIQNVRQRQAPDAVMSDYSMVPDMPFQIPESQVCDESDARAEARTKDFLGGKRGTHSQVSLTRVF